MSTESLTTNSASNASSSHHHHHHHTSKTKQTLSSEQSQLSDSIQNDLTHNTTHQLSNNNKKTTTTTTSSADSRQSQKMITAPAPTTSTSPTALQSPQSSPTKSTPTKSRNKRRNQKRSANTKKQQENKTMDKNQVTQSQQNDGKQIPNNQENMSQIPSATLTPPSNGEQEEKDEISSEIQPQQERSTQETPSPSPQKVDEQQQQQQQQYESKDTNNGSVSPVKMKPSSESHRKSPSNQNKQGMNNHGEPATTTTPTSNSRSAHDTNSWRRKQRENRELREQVKLRDTQLQNFAERIKQQINKIKELEASLVSTTRTCGQFEKLLQQELTNRTKLESEIDSLNTTVSRLRSQVNAHEKDRSANNELIRVLNATLMERETEVSILKLKMTRIQTNSMSTDATSNFSLSNNRTTTTQDPSKAFTMAGRSNSEFSRNSYARSTMMADAISARSSTSQLQQQQQQNNERDASVWATVPRELTPSKRPVMLERNLPAIYTEHSIYSNDSSPIRNQSTPLARDRRYRTLPKSMKSPQQYEESCVNNEASKLQQQKQEANLGDARDVTKPAFCLVTNLDDSNNTSRSSDNTRSLDMNNEPSKHNRTFTKPKADAAEVVEITKEVTTNVQGSSNAAQQEDGLQSANPTYSNDFSHYSTIGNTTKSSSEIQASGQEATARPAPPPALPARSPSTPVKISFGFKKIFGKFKRSDSSTGSTHSKTDLTSIEPPLTPVTTAPPAFQRGGSRSTMMGPPSTSSIRAQLSPRKAIEFQTDKPFAEWDNNMLVDWLTMIGLSMYATQCRRWVKCGAHIMNATPAEVDKGLGITNHLHRKKLRLAISELNGDCDKITKAAAKLDYLWVARWLDDIGLPQYKEAFINARVDGRVLNYLTIEDLVSMGVKSLLHHSSIKCGIRVLRSINFDLQLLKRRATAEEIEQMNSVRRSIDEQSNNLTPAHQATKGSGSTSSGGDVKVCDETEVQLWTCHRIMEWLRMIDFAEFAPNLRGSGVHGGLIIYEDAFNNDTMSALLSIPSGKTLLRRHLSTYFKNLVGDELVQRKLQHKEQLPSSQQLNPSAEIKIGKKSQLWFGKLKSSKVGQDGMDEYLCPMYPVEPQIVKSPIKKPEAGHREGSNLPRIPESVNV